MEFKYDPGRKCLIASGGLTIYHAAQAKAPLLAYPGACLDLSGIEEMDGAGLQLLLLAQRDAGMRLVAASEPVIEVLRLSGLDHTLEARV